MTSHYKSFDPLTTKGTQTPGFFIGDAIYHSFVVKVSGLTEGNSVSVNFEGSLNGSDWVPLYDSDKTLSENGTFLYVIKQTPMMLIRCAFNNQVGDDEVSIQITYKGQ